MSRRNQYEVNYARIETLLKRPITDLEPFAVVRLRSSGFMDLVVEGLPDCPETGAKVLSLCHYFEQNGDLCQDPEMTVRLFVPGSTMMRSLVPSTDSTLGRAEATSFQQALPPIYQEVYPEPGKFYPRLRRDLNSFLGTWLRNLEAQGHLPVDPESGRESGGAVTGARLHHPRSEEFREIMREIRRGLVDHTARHGF